MAWQLIITVTYGWQTLHCIKYLNLSQNHDTLPLQLDDAFNRDQFQANYASRLLWPLPPPERYVLCLSCSLSPCSHVHRIRDLDKIVLLTFLFSSGINSYNLCLRIRQYRFLLPMDTAITEFWSLMRLDEFYGLFRSHRNFCRFKFRTVWPCSSIWI